MTLTTFSCCWKPSWSFLSSSSSLFCSFLGVTAGADWKDLRRIVHSHIEWLLLGWIGHLLLWRILSNWSCGLSPFLPRGVRSIVPTVSSGLRLRVGSRWLLGLPRSLCHFPLLSLLRWGKRLHSCSSSP